MRFEILSSLLNVQIDLINISEDIYSCNRIVRSVGWRFKIGPMIWRISKSINRWIIKNNNYELIWIDKGVFISFDVMKKLKLITGKLVHFTPDPAFYYHKSSFFFKSLYLFDYCVTTKSYEIDLYNKYRCNKVIYCTQGYDERIHKSVCAYDDKQFEVCFIGHFEENRGRILQELIDSNIKVLLAGIKWRSFYLKNINNDNLTYVGENLAGMDYVEAISKSYISLGLISSWVPEKHTTRTFEIPACGSLLITPRNEEIENFFDESEVVFFDSDFEITQLVKNLLMNKEILKDILVRGNARVKAGPFSYQKQLFAILKSIELI